MDRIWADLDGQLAAHRAGDAKEAADVAFIREFLRRHPADAHLRSRQEGHLTGSAFVLDHTRTQVLLLFHGKLHRWLQPGGHGEGETEPRLVALREVLEETGLRSDELSPWPDARILDVDVHRIPARKDEPEHAHLDLRYGFVARQGAAPRVSDESRELRFFPLTALPAGLDPALLRALGKLRGPRQE